MLWLSAMMVLLTSLLLHQLGSGEVSLRAAVSLLLAFHLFLLAVGVSGRLRQALTNTLTGV